jgi:hypothetical protein
VFATLRASRPPSGSRSAKNDEYIGPGYINHDAFGQVTAARDSRRIQLALRFTF